MQKTIEYNPQANIMNKEQAEELRKDDRVREEHPFELNMVMQRENDQADELKDDRLREEHPFELNMVMQEENDQADELKYDRLREEHPFELNMVMQEENDQADKLKKDRVREELPFKLNIVMQKENIISGRLHCFPTEEEEEGSQDQCPYEYPVNISDDRVLIAGVICEEELDMENRKRRVDIDRRWLIDSGASSHYIKEISKFRAYK